MKLKNYFLSILGALIVVCTPMQAQLLYVLNFAGNSLSVFDNNQIPPAIIATIPVGNSPVAMVMSSDGTRIYVANSDFAHSSLSVIDTATRTSIATLTVGTFPFALALSPNNQTLYVANGGSDSVSVVNTTSLTVTSTITLPSGSFPQGLVLSSDGNTLYVADQGTGDVTAINLTTLVQTEIPIGGGPQPEAISPNNQFVFVGDFNGNTVTLIDTATADSLSTVTVGSIPYWLTLAPNGQFLYSVNNGSNNVSVIDVSLAPVATVVDTIPVGASPTDLTFSTAGLLFYVVNNVDNTVSVFDSTTNTLLYSFPATAGGGAIQLLLGPADIPSNSTITVTPPSVPADGVTPVTVLVTLKGVNGLPLSGKTVTITAANGSSVITPTSAITNSAGQVTFSITDSVIETVTYTVTDLTDVAVVGSFPISFTTPGPINFNGKLVKNKFATQTDLVDVLNWSPSPDPAVVGYLIVQNGQIVAQVPASGPFTVSLHNRKVTPNIYMLYSFNAANVRSAPQTITVQ